MVIYLVSHFFPRISTQTFKLSQPLLGLSRLVLVTLPSQPTKRDQQGKETSEHHHFIFCSFFPRAKKEEVNYSIYLYEPRLQRKIIDAAVGFSFNKYVLLLC